MDYIEIEVDSECSNESRNDYWLDGLWMPECFFGWILNAQNDIILLKSTAKWCLDSALLNKMYCAAVFHAKRWCLDSELLCKFSMIQECLLENWQKKAKHTCASSPLCKQKKSNLMTLLQVSRTYRSTKLPLKYKDKGYVHF